MDKKRAFDFLEALSFIRVSTTPEEYKAAEMIKAECDKMGVKAEIVPFEMEVPNVTKVKLEATKPEVKEWYCTGLGKSGFTGDEGVVGPLAYIENGEDENITDVKGKIVLSTGGMKNELREKLIKKGALGYITTWGGFYDDEDMIKEVPHRFARLKKDDTTNFPGVMMNLLTAEKLVMSKPEEVRLVLQQENPIPKANSWNVVATIEGTDPDLKSEELVFSAHMDSVEFSKGSWDNGTGTVTILELCHYFAEHPAKRTVKFVWCGSEEVGLNGSLAYCEMNKEDLANVILDINIDMQGVLFGTNYIFGNCDKSVVDHAAYMAKCAGMACNTRIGAASSDSTSFNAFGVPAIGFGRMSVRSGAEIHSHRDTMEHLDADTFIRLCDFIAVFADEVANAAVNPIPRKLPEEVTKGVDNMKKMLGWD